MSTEKENKQSNWSWKTILIGLVTFLTYTNTFNHDFVLDDDVVFLKNEFVQAGFKGIPDIFSHGFLYGFNQKNDQSYRPIATTYYAIVHQFFGNNAKALHILTVLFYTLACLLLYRFLKLAFKARYQWLPFWASLLFAVHPIHTEVVANVKGMDEILHFIFAICSLHYFLKDYDREKSASVLSLLFFSLAILSKEIGLSLLFIAPLSLWTFRKVEWKQLFMYSWPLLVVVAVYFLLRNLILDTVTFKEDMQVINNALAAADNYPQQLASTIYIFSEYIKLLFVPHPLSWDYSYPHFPIVNFRHWRVLLTISLFMGALILSCKGLLERKVWAYSFFFFCAAFALTSNFLVLIGATLGERFMFFPSVGFSVFMIWGIFKLINLISTKKKSQIAAFQGIVLTIAVLFVVKTFSRNRDWKSNETLFKAGVEATPNNSRAQSALASTYRIKGEQSRVSNQRQQLLMQAKQAYEKSIELLPSNVSAWYNLGVTYMSMGDDKKAEAAFLKAIEYDEDYINALNNLGVINFRRQDLAEAEKYFKQCLRLNMQFQSAYANLGAVYHNQGQLDKAKLYYEEALKLNPQDANTRANYQKLQNK